MTVALRIWLVDAAVRGSTIWGVVMARDIEATAIPTASGDGAVGNQEARGGLAVFVIGQRIGYVNGLGPGAADDEVAADVHDDRGDTRSAERDIDSAIHNVALNEGIQGERRIAEVSSRPG